MFILLKLCNSIIRKNKGFTLCILIMSILSTSIGFLGANFGISSQNTIDNFIKESNMPDAVYVTDIIDNNIVNKIKKIDGVENIFKRFIYDTNIETSNNDVYSVRLFREDIDSKFKHQIHSYIDCDVDLPKLSISKEFADHNNILPGDYIFINTDEGKRKAIVKAKITNPETMECAKDDMSSYEGYQFAYIYVDENDFKKLVDVGEVYNQLLIYFNDDFDIDKQRQCMDSIHEVLSSNIIDETLTIESQELLTIKDDLNTIAVICKFVPSIIWLISLGFTFIFIKIIVDNQRTNIGLLRALGFSKNKVIIVFVLYTIVINIPSIILGLLFGYKILELCTGIIASSKGIIDTVITVLRVPTIIMSLVILLIGIFAALLSANSISKIDPSIAYGGFDNVDIDPPSFISKLQLDSFIKISIVSLIRNYKRQIIGSLCICACIISMCIGLEGVMTIGHPIDAVYGQRYKYDLMIRNIDSKTIQRIKDEVKGIETFEPEIVFTASLLAKDVNVSTIDDKDVLTVLNNSDSDIIYPKDGIIIDEMCAKLNNLSIGDKVKLNDTSLTITGIARQILHNVMYINMDTAFKLGYGEYNCLCLKIDDNVDINTIEEKISSINKDAYFVEISSQKQNIKDAFIAMRTVMFVFALLAFFIGTFLIINITIIDFNESRIKYAILKALGTPVSRIGKVSLLQNLFRIIVGIVLAIPLSYVANTILLDLLSNASQQYVMVKYNMCFIISCLLPLLYVLFGEIISFIKIRNLDFSKCLNEME